jgi:hypothetical protein
MKTRNSLFIILLLLPIKLIGQTEFAINSSYDPYEDAILIHITNPTDKIMQIRNDDGTGSGSHMLFQLKDRTGEVFSYYEAVFFETADYQRFVSINPRSTKTFKYYMKHLQSSYTTKVHSVDVDCYIRYSIPEKSRYEFVNKKISTKIIKPDLMILSQHDGRNLIMIILSNTSDYEMIIRNSTTAIRFDFFDKKGELLGTTNAAFVQSGTTPTTIKITQHSGVRFDYQLQDISKNITRQSEITTVKASCRVNYDIPSKNILNNSSSKNHMFKIIR